MSKSFDFALSVANDKERSCFYGRNFENATEMDADSFFNQYVSTDRHFHSYFVDVDVEFDPESDFDYCVTNSYLSDGTLLNSFQTIGECFLRIIKGETFYKPKGAWKQGSQIKYVCGNIIYLVEHGKFGTEEKPWLSERISVMVPVKYDVIGEERE